MRGGAALESEQRAALAGPDWRAWKARRLGVRGPFLGIDVHHVEHAAARLARASRNAPWRRKRRRHDRSPGAPAWHPPSVAAGDHGNSRATAAGRGAGAAAVFRFGAADRAGSTRDRRNRLQRWANAASPPGSSMKQPRCMRWVCARWRNMFQARILSPLSGGYGMRCARYSRSCIVLDLRSCCEVCSEQPLATNLRPGPSNRKKGFNHRCAQMHADRYKSGIPVHHETRSARHGKSR